MSKSVSVESLENLLSNVQLPALPQSAISLLELSQDPDNGPNEFAVPIEADPGLTSQVLRFVNSSYFGFSREISSIKLAINLVGVRTIKNFALWSAVFSLMPNPKCGVLDLKCLWQDSLRRGLFARELGKKLGAKDSEDFFAAALLQDMAIPILAKELGDTYEQLITTSNADHARLSDLEQEAFGWNHAEAAAEVGRSWSLPAEFIRLIEGHVHLEKWLETTPLDPGQIAVSFSSLLPIAHKDTWSEHKLFSGYYAELAPHDVRPLAELFEEVDRQFEEFAPLLKIESKTMPLTEYLTNAVEEEKNSPETDSKG
ncbi:MAG: HDOD domain-containing protein [Pirellulaceae bacterium]|nr:HDOD domain-containing protein [Pirellulaceae bacterium]